MAGHVQDVWYDPYGGIAVSAVTSQTVDLRDAIAWTMSWTTTAGTTSAHTLQVSNSSVNASLTSVPNASFVNYVTFGTGTPAVIVGDPGVRYARFLRVASGASVVIDLNKQVG